MPAFYIKINTKNIKTSFISSLFISNICIFCKNGWPWFAKMGGLSPTTEAKSDYEFSVKMQ